MKFLRDSSFTIASQLLAMLLGLLASILVARAFGPEGRGLFALLLLSIMAIALFTNLGLGPAAVFFTGRREVLPHVSASLLLIASIAIGTSVAALFIAIVVVFHVSSVGEIPIKYWMCIAALTPFALAKRYASYLFVSLSDFRWYNYTNLIELGTRIVAILVVMALRRSGTSPILTSIALSVVVAAVLSWLQIGRQVKGLALRAEPALVRKFGQYGIRFYFAELIPFLSLRVDQFLIGAFLGIADVGLYAAAVSLAEILRIASLAVSAVLFGKVASVDKDKATDLTCTVSRISMAASILGGLFLLLCGGGLLKVLYGSRFVTAAPILWLLLPGVIMNNSYEILYADLAGRGRPEIGLYIRLSSLCLVVVGDSLLVPRWGVLGAGLIASLAQIFSGSLLTLFYRRYTQQKLSRIVLVNRSDLSILWRYARQVLLCKGLT